MTRFIRIDPTGRTVEAVEAPEWYDAAKTLKRTQVDFGMITQEIAIVVYEYGLMEGDGPYFALEGQLYSGEAILFAADEAGETINMPARDIKPLWLADKGEVELAIAARLVQRPCATINGVVTWQWS